MRTILITIILLFTIVHESRAESSFTDFLAPVCVSPSIEPGGCIRVKDGNVEIGLKVRYYYPAAIIEVVPKACSFFFLDILGIGQVISEACNNLPFMQSQGGQLDWLGQQNLMRVHVHVYALPKPIQAKIEAWFRAMFPYLPCIKIPTPVSIKNLIKNLADVPVFASEFVAPLWLNDLVNPDVRTIVPIINAIINTLYVTNPAIGVAVCPGLTQLMADYKLIPDNPIIDPEFICVGFWGRGYPRMGAISHDDYKTAEALAAVRFWHMYSKTVPVISLEYSTAHKMNVIYPFLSPCFHPGNPLLTHMPVPPTGAALNPLESRRIIFLVWKAVGCCKY
jgi:hypothetical protein